MDGVETFLEIEGNPRGRRSVELPWLLSPANPERQPSIATRCREPLSTGGHLVTRRVTEMESRRAGPGLLSMSASTPAGRRNSFLRRERDGIFAGESPR